MSKDDEHILAKLLLLACGRTSGVGSGDGKSRIVDLGILQEL